MRRKERQAPYRPTDDELRRSMAAQLVGTRIFLGLKPEDVLERIGYTFKNAPRAEKRGLSREKWVVYRLALLENELAEGRLSMLQRYSRAVGAQLLVRVDTRQSRSHQHVNMRRVRRIAARKRAARRRLS